MKIKKKQIDTIDAKAYTDDAFVGDLFAQLKTAPIETFASKYKWQAINWRMDRLMKSETLTNNTSLRYTNMESRKL